MNLFLLGATGATGRQLLDQALAAGHDVTALVRTPASLAVTHPRLTVVQGDATDEQSLAAALPGHDVVLSALGAGRNLKSDIASSSATALIAAAGRTGVTRVIVLSAFGVGGTVADASGPQKLMFKAFMKGIFSDKAVADDRYRASDLDYTLVYPVTLSDGAATGRVRAERHPRLKGLPKISRADVASFMLAEAGQSTWIRDTAVLTTA